jgi:tetratricopeptide (TPR) repeat protein
MVQWGASHVLIKMYADLLPPLGVLNRRDQGRVYSQLAMLYGRTGDHDQAQRYVEEALAIQRQLHDTRGEATTFANLGELCRMRNEYNQAHVCFERALSLSIEVQDVLLQCIVQHNLGLLSHQEKEYKQAYLHYQEALKCSYQLSGSQGQYYSGMVLTNLGMLLYEQGMRTEGISILLGALKMRQTLQDSSVVLLDQFLKTLEQKLGHDLYVRLRQKALAMQPEVFSRFVTPSARE